MVEILKSNNQLLGKDLYKVKSSKYFRLNSWDSVHKNAMRNSHFKGEAASVCWPFRFQETQN